MKFSCIIEKPIKVILKTRVELTSICCDIAKINVHKKDNLMSIFSL